MKFIATTQMTVEAETPEEARIKVMDTLWRHYGQRNTTDLTKAVDLKIHEAGDYHPGMSLKD